jgi:hypothetical protein
VRGRLPENRGVLARLELTIELGDVKGFCAAAENIRRGAPGEAADPVESKHIPYDLTANGALWSLRVNG